MTVQSYYGYTSSDIVYIYTDTTDYSTELLQMHAATGLIKPTIPFSSDLRAVNAATGRQAADAPVHSNLRSSPLERFVSQCCLQSACRTVARRGRSSRSTGRLEIRREPAAVRCHANIPAAPTALSARQPSPQPIGRRGGDGCGTHSFRGLQVSGPHRTSAARTARGKGCCAPPHRRGKPELLWGASAARVQL